MYEHWYGKYRLHWQAFLGAYPRVKELLEEGADVNARDAGGWTPALGVRGRQNHVIELLGSTEPT